MPGHCTSPIRNPSDRLFRSESARASIGARRIPGRLAFLRPNTDHRILANLPGRRQDFQHATTGQDVETAGGQQATAGHFVQSRQTTFRPIARAQMDRLFARSDLPSQPLQRPNPLIRDAGRTVQSLSHSPRGLLCNLRKKRRGNLWASHEI